VKVLKPDTGEIPDRLPRFEREAQAVAALNHPISLRCTTSGNDSGIVFAVTELLEGGTVRNRLNASGRRFHSVDLCAELLNFLAQRRHLALDVVHRVLS
jgi:serine/threonine protein kinase